MQPDSITLTVTPALMNTLMNALAAMPYKDAAPAIQNLQQQVQAQLAPPAMPRPMGVVPSQPEGGQPVGKTG
jgi:hypothetical protein